MKILSSLSENEFNDYIGNLRPLLALIAKGQKKFESLAISRGYDFPESYSYINQKTKVFLECKETGHGAFLIAPTKMIHRNQGCPKCGRIKNHKNIRFSESNVLIKVKEVYRNYQYDYSLFEYVNASTPFKVICPEHGVFTKVLQQVIKKKEGCRTCGYIAAGLRKRISENEYINRAIKIHKTKKYKYIGIKWNGKFTLINYMCLEHGEIMQPLKSHLAGGGCDKCADIVRSKKRALSQEEFIELANKVHGQYSYYNADYQTAVRKVMVTCSKHGDFSVTGGNHLRGKGCPVCKCSKGELKVRNHLLSLRLNFKQQYTFPSCISIAKLPFDFMVSINNSLLMIEYHGIQHYEPIDFFGGITALDSNINRDKIKTLYCKDNKHELLVIPHWDYEKIEEIINKTLEKY